MSLFMNTQNRLIGRDEVLLRDNGKWLHFSNAHRIIQADVLGDVLPALREIEAMVRGNEWYAAGFLGYESSSAFDEAHQTTEMLRPVQGIFPYLWFGLYPRPRVITLPETLGPTQGVPASAQAALTWLPSVDGEAYNAAIDQIRALIAEGRTYQVNYTMRLRTEFKIDAWNFFLQLAQTQNNHAAYIDLGRYVICSASPELFFQLDGENITCRPMKGTMQRGRTTLEDAKQAQALKESEKNRAENVMIVDMVRNDLGRIAKIGSVHVPE